MNAAVAPFRVMLLVLLMLPAPLMAKVPEVTVVAPL
jgi:hypothetical protein